MSQKISVVFFGTGPVAAQSLELLLNTFDVEAVITKPKPSHHRGEFPVLEIAKKYHLTVHAVTDKKSLSELFQTTQFSSDVAILIDFGIIVTQDIIDYFKKGIVNSHFSLLPEWRGADPITFSVLSGQKQTGVSLMLLVEAMDEGPLLAVGKQAIESDETTMSLTQKLISLSDILLQKEVPEYLLGDTKGIDQSKMHTLIPDYPRAPSYSRKLTKNDGLLDFNKPAVELEREIRAFKQWPKSKTTLHGNELVITDAHVVNEPGNPGSYELRKNELIIFTSKKALSIDELKPSGKPAMPIAAFLAGYKNRL